MIPFGDFSNYVSVPQNTYAGDKSTGLGQYGLINTQWSVDNTDRSKQYEIDYQKADSTVVYTPTSTQYTIPIITISGSEVRDTGNTAYTQPSTFTPSISQSAEATHSDTEKTGINLTEVIVPVAVVGGIAALGYALITTVGGK